MNILQMTGLLKALDPKTVDSTIKSESFNLNPIEPGKMVKRYKFNPGYLLYIYLYINDYGTGIGKYITLKAQRIREEQILSKPEIEGAPIGMYEERAFREKGVNPGLVEYDDTNGIYVIECNFQRGEAQIEDPYQISIMYPRKELIAEYEDTVALSNYGKSVYCEIYIAVKEIDYERVAEVLKEYFAEVVKEGIRKAFEVSLPITIPFGR